MGTEPDPPKDRISVILRLDLVSHLETPEEREALPAVLVNHARRATLAWCETVPGADPLALLTAAVGVRDDSNLAGMGPIPDQHELRRVVGDVDQVHFSELDLYWR